MPALSPTMTKGGVTSWLVSEGQKVSAGDVLAEIQTDKATMEMESMEDGFVAKILIEAGREDIDVGTPLLVMVTAWTALGAETSRSGRPLRPDLGLKPCA